MTEQKDNLMSTNGLTATNLNDSKMISLFDIGKARQAIYSILMGFILKYFIEHVYNSWPSIMATDVSIKWLYLLLLAYFLMNCFRFLFGLVDLSNMTDNTFAPAGADWTLAKFFSNLFKLLVINTGIFQLVIFSFLVFVLFPPCDMSSKDSAELLSGRISTEFPLTFHKFIIGNSILMFIDIICVGLYLFLEKKDSIDRNERYQSGFWIAAGIIELIISFFGYCASDSGNNINLPIIKGVIYFLLSFSLFEIVGGYKYIGHYLEKYIPKKTS